MKFPKIFISVLVAAGLFLGASNANASFGQVTWLVIDAESASDPDFTVIADLCIQAVAEIEGLRGNYTQTGQNRITDRISMVQFRSIPKADIVFLYCYGFSSDINPFGPGPF